MKYKAALFDMNGVIVDDEELHEAAFDKVLTAKGFDFDHQKYIEHFAGKTDEFGFQSFYSSAGVEIPDMRAILNEKTAAYKSLASSLKPYPGVFDYINALEQAGYRLGLVTGSSQQETEIVLSTLKAKTLFEVQITADQITKSKPNPEGYLKAASAMKLQPDECFVVEDTPSGVSAARAAGMACIAVTNTHTADQLAKATLVVEALNKNLLIP